MNERITINYDNLNIDIDTILNEIQFIRNERLFMQIMGDDVKKIKEWEKSLIKRINDPFNVVIAGDFKRGKSTLINALLGDEVVPTNVLPETVTINKISYGEDFSCTAVLKNGKKARLDPKELKRKELEKIIDELPDEIEYVDIKQNNDLLKEISMIDTPGTGDIFNKFDVQVSEYLKYADALIYVVSAKSPLSFTEQNFISAAIIPQSFSRIFVVINMADCLENTEDIDKITSFTRDRIENITPNASVFCVSALDEYCRLQNLPRPVKELTDYLENNFEYFRTSLNSDLILQKNIIKTMRVVSIAEFMLKDINRRADLFIGVITSKIEGLSTLEEQYKNKDSEFSCKIEREISNISLDIDEMQYDANQWISEFMNRIKIEMQSIQSTTTTELLQKYFQFYIIEKIKIAVVACTDKHQKIINEKLHKAAENISLEICATFDSIDSRVADSIFDISWTNVDTAMFATDFILGSINGLNLGPIMLIGQAIAGFIRKKETNNMHKEFLEPILQNYDDIVSEVLNEVRIVYNRMRNAAVEKLNSIYNEQIEQSIFVVNKAKQIKQSEELKQEDVILYLNETKDKITGLLSALEKYK